MMLLLRALAAVLLLCAGASGWAAREAGPLQRRPAVEDTRVARVIVKYRADSALMRPLAAGAPRPQHAAALSARLGLALVDGRVLGARTQALRGVGLASAALAAQLAAQPDVEWAVVDGRKTISAARPNDPYFGGGQTAVTPAAGQWYLRAPTATFVSAIDALGAWSTTAGSAAVTVAVLDTGVRFDHPDLRFKLWGGYDFITDAATAADGNGRDGDASDPGDWTPASADCGAGDSSWHGTQTAGLVGAATDNGVGMAGTGRDVMVLPVRVLGQCGGYDSDIIAAMRWAAGLSSDPVANPHPAQVINMSLGSTGACSAAYQDAFAEVNAAGVSVVVAAGNDEGLGVGTPANCPGAIAVGGLRHIGTKVGFSDVGPEIALSAPAGNCVNLSGTCLYPILTTTNSGKTTPETNTYSDGTRYSVGTSFAAPLVAGTAALMLSVNPALTPAAVRAALRASARPFPTGGADPGVPVCHAPNGSVQDECYCTTGTCGAGMLDSAAAVAAVLTAAGAPPRVALDASTLTPTAGDGVTLDGSGSTAGAGRTLVGYAWRIVAGGSAASIVGSDLGTRVTLATRGAGDVIVELTVTDDAGASTAKTVGLRVQAAPGTTPQGGAGGGGGGAMSVPWLALLALAAGLLARDAAPGRLSAGPGRARTPRR